MANYRNVRDIRQYEIMIQVAKMYYMENLSQQQISERIHMSRSNVSRILNNCKDAGIVEIRIHEAALRTHDIKKSIIERFKIKNAVIVPRGAETDSVLDIVSQVAADYVEDILTDGMTVGIGWGSTVHRLVNVIRPSSYHDSHVIQLIGGTSLRETYKDGVQLTLDFARKTGASPHILNAPLIVSSKEVRDLFIEENCIKQHLGMSSQIDAAIVTIGTNDPDRNSMVSAGYLTADQSRELCERGLHTHILGQHIDDYGALGDVDFNDRVVGIGLGTFRKIPVRIGIACGEYKSRQIAAALMGGYINTLITDELTAIQVEQHARSLR